MSKPKNDLIEALLSLVIKSFRSGQNNSLSRVPVCKLMGPRGELHIQGLILEYLPLIILNLRDRGWATSSKSHPA